MCVRLSPSHPAARIVVGLYILLAAFLTGFFVAKAIELRPSPPTVTLLVPQPEPVNASVWKNTKVDPAPLCKRLREIRKIPFDPNERSGDPIYDGLRDAGYKAVPCLIDKLTDTELIEIPEGIPPVHNVRVGDAALFMLMYITEYNWAPDPMFPRKDRPMFRTDRLNSYYWYVDKPLNRKRLQQAWENWLRKTNNGADSY